MEALLKSLEPLKELQIVRFFAQFFSEERLSPLVSQYKARVAGDPAGLARDLILWAVVLAIVTFAIDQAFYWTQRGRIEQAIGAWQSFRDGAGHAWDGAVDFIRRFTSGERMGGSRGRR